MDRIAFEGQGPMELKNYRFSLICALGVFLIQIPVSVAQTDPNGVVSSPVQQSPEEVERYWTPERMREAKPMPMPIVVDPGHQDPEPTAPASSATIAPGGTVGQGIVYPDRPETSRFPDYPLEIIPSGPLLVSFVFEHRTALNEKHITIHGMIQDTLLGEKACPPDRGMCAQPRVTLADSESRTKYTIEILLREDDNTPYTKGQILDFSGTVSSGVNSTILRSE